MSPRPAQRSVFASAAAAASASTASAAATAAVRIDGVMGSSSRDVGGRGAPRRLSNGRDHNPGYRRKVESRRPRRMAATSPAARLVARLPDTMAADAQSLARRIERARRGPAGPAEWQRIEAAIARSAERRQARAARRPAISYPAELPVAQRAEEIAAAIGANPVVIVCGETGSGKTTQLPKICLALGRGERGLIGHTQPRRIAARAVAARIAHELGTPPGEAVGYKVRFADHTKPDAFVKLMTDGILLAETQGDPLLAAYDTIIVDEAHERSLNIDFLLGYLKELLPRRPDLKVIVTSATLDADRFARHFAGEGRPAPVIEVSGRVFPVEVRYRALASGADEADDEEELED